MREAWRRFFCPDSSIRMSRAPRVLILPSIPASHLPPSLFGDGRERWETVAQVVADNVAMYPGPASVVLRPDRSPRLIVVGWFTEDEEAQLRRAIDHFVRALGRLRYVDYAQAEADCAVLADRLRAILSPDALESATFVGIPRGGFIVLGMLGYTLGLVPEQFGTAPATGAPLVVVDDCFLTGSRIARFLDEQPRSENVILAGLYAHPDLCASLERERPSVRACVQARSLTDHAPEIYGEEYEDWRERWDNRDTGPHYWRGMTDHLCFAWGEPDGGLWNPTTRRVDSAWTTVPPHRCLKTRAEDRDEGTVHVQSPATGPFGPSDAVVYAALDDSTIVGHLGTGTVLVFDDTAAVFWHALAAHGELDPAAEVLATTYDVPAETLAKDLRAFANTLQEHRLLQQDSSSDLSRS